MIALITAYILNIVDYIFTAYWVHKFGIEIEANPIGRWMFENNVAWVFKIIILGGLFAVLWYCMRKSAKAVIGAKVLLCVCNISLNHLNSNNIKGEIYV